MNPKTSCLPWAIASVVIMVLFILGVLVPWITARMQDLMGGLPV